MIDIIALDAATTQAVSIVIGIIGLGAVVFAALRFGREDTKMLSSTATELVSGMKTVSEQFKLQRDEARVREKEAKERADVLIHENQALREEVSALREEVKKLRCAIEEGKSL